MWMHLSPVTCIHGIKCYHFHFYWNSDGAYSCTETNMTPVPGVNLHITDRDADSFNYWHSQIRIIIECTFGLFIQRWGFSMEHNFAITQCCVRLHNFCVDNNLPIEITKKRTPPAHAVVDSEEKLHSIWKIGADPQPEWNRYNIKRKIY
jgi:hypothetical protein